MKTAMKKLLSFVLVAMLLVTAIPFQASAATGYTIKALSTDGTVLTTANQTSETTISDLISTCALDSAYTFSYAERYTGSGSVTITDTSTEIDADATTGVRLYFTYTSSTSDDDDDTEETTSATTATTATVDPISIVVKVDSSDNVVWSGTKEPANGSYATVANLLKYCFNSGWDDVYDFDHAWSSNQQKNVALSGYIYAGDTVYIMLTTSSSSSSNSSSTTTTTKLNSNKVYLHIFLNNDVSAPVKSINITSGIALDGVVTLAEVKTVVKNYYTAKTSDGIGYDGLYFATGSYAYNWITDSEKYDTISNIDELLADGYVNINVMITNATAKSSSSSTADSSNPKTGDTIYTTMTVMTVSACALALVYFFNKKRAVR